MSVDAALRHVLSNGANAVVKIRHSWLRIFAQNVQGQPGLLLELDDPLPHYIDGGKGFSVQAGTGQGAFVGNYIRIVSSTSEVTPAFVALSSYLIDESNKSGSAGASLSDFFQALEEFRDFLSKPRGRLGEDLIRGLTAELILLRELTDQLGSIANALQRWNGPYGNSKDFIFPAGHCVEVKSARRPTLEVNISSIDQLETPNVSLQLAVLPMERSESADDESIGLVDLLEELAGEARTDPQANRLWVQALDGLGLEHSDPYYAEWRFRVGDWLAFDVVNGFPRLRAAEIPAGVAGVQYKLRVDALADFASVLRLS
jgi:hypothetical protein